MLKIYKIKWNKISSKKIRTKHEKELKMLKWSKGLKQI